MTLQSTMLLLVLFCSVVSALLEIDVEVPWASLNCPDAVDESSKTLTTFDQFPLPAAGSLPLQIHGEKNGPLVLRIQSNGAEEKTLMCEALDRSQGFLSLVHPDLEGKDVVGVSHIRLLKTDNLIVPVQKIDKTSSEVMAHSRFRFDIQSCYSFLKQSHEDAEIASRLYGSEFKQFRDVWTYSKAKKRFGPLNKVAKVLGQTEGLSNAGVVFFFLLTMDFLKVLIQTRSSVKPDFMSASLSLKTDYKELWKHLTPDDLDYMNRPKCDAVNLFTNLQVDTQQRAVLDTICSIISRNRIEQQAVSFDVTADDLKNIVDYIPENPQNTNQKIIREIAQYKNPFQGIELIGLKESADEGQSTPFNVEMEITEQLNTFGVRSKLEGIVALHHMAMNHGNHGKRGWFGTRRSSSEPFCSAAVTDKAFDIVDQKLFASEADIKYDEDQQEEDMKSESDVSSISLGSRQFYHEDGQLGNNNEQTFSVHDASSDDGSVEKSEKGSILAIEDDLPLRQDGITVGDENEEDTSQQYSSVLTSPSNSEKEQDATQRGALDENYNSDFESRSEAKKSDDQSEILTKMSFEDESKSVSSLDGSYDSNNGMHLTGLQPINGDENLSSQPNSRFGDGSDEIDKKRMNSVPYDYFEDVSDSESVNTILNANDISQEMDSERVAEQSSEGDPQFLVHDASSDDDSDKSSGKGPILAIEDVIPLRPDGTTVEDEEVLTKKDPDNSIVRADSSSVNSGAERVPQTNSIPGGLEGNLDGGETNFHVSDVGSTDSNYAPQGAKEEDFDAETVGLIGGVMNGPDHFATVGCDSDSKSTEDLSNLVACRSRQSSTSSLSEFSPFRSVSSRGNEENDFESDVDFPDGFSVASIRNDNLTPEANGLSFPADDSVFIPDANGVMIPDETASSVSSSSSSEYPRNIIVRSLRANSDSSSDYNPQSTGSIVSRSSGSSFLESAALPSNFISKPFRDSNSLQPHFL